MPGYNPYPGKAAGGKTQKKATAAARAYSQSTAGKIQTAVGKQLVYAPLYLVPGASSVRGAVLTAKAAKAANISIPKQLGIMTRNTGAAISKAVGRGGTKGLQTSPGKGVVSPRLSTKRKVAGAAVAGGAVAYGLSRIPTSNAAPRQKYSGMKPGAEKVRTGPGGAYVGSGMGAKARPKTGGSYVGSTVGGNTGSRKAPATPTPTAGAAQRQRSGAVKSKPKIKRTALVKERLRLAEERAARGDVAGAAAYANAALNIQKKGKGTAQSMRRVQRVATTYQQAASAGKKPIKRKKG